MEEYNTQLPVRQFLDSYERIPLPPVQQYQPMAPAAPIAPPVPQQQAPAGPGLIPTLVMQKEQLLGRKLKPEDFTDIAEYSKAMFLGDMARKGADKWAAEATLPAFEQDFAKMQEAYLSANVAQIATGEGETENSGGFLNNALQTVGSVAAGGAELVGGIAKLIDYPLRLAQAYGANMDAIAGGTAKNRNESYIDLLTKGSHELLADYGVAPRGISKITQAIAGGASSAAQGIREATYTPGTLRAQEELGKLLEADATPGQIIGHLKSNPALIATMLGEVAPGLGVTKLATKLPQFAAVLDKVGKAGRAGKAGEGVLLGLPAGLGYAGSAVNAFEKDINERPLADLLKQPKNQELYQLAMDTVGPEKAEQRLREIIIAHGSDTVMASSLAANVLLLGVPGLGGAERAIGGAATVAKKGLRRVAGATTSEATQEAIAGGMEQAGTNIAANIPTGEGVEGAATIGAVVGAAAGGAVAPFTSGRRGLKTPSPTTETATPDTPDATAPNAAVPPTPTGPTFSDTPFAGFDKVQASVIGAFQENNSLKAKAKKEANAIETPAELLVSAESIAQLMVGKTKGVEWTALSQEQQGDLTEALAEILNKSRKNKFEDLGTVITDWKAARVAPVAPVAPVEVPVPVPVPVAEAAPVAPTAPVPESTAEEVRAAIAEVGATVQPPVAAPVVPAPVPAPIPAAAVAAPVSPIQQYLQALVNPGPATPEQQGVRSDPHFAEMQQLMSEGKIENTAQLEAALAAAQQRDEQTPPRTLKSTSSVLNATTIGELAGDKGRSKRAIEGRKLAQQATEALVSQGFKPEDINAMTPKQAQSAYDAMKGKPLKTKPKAATPKKGLKQSPKQVAPAQVATGAAETNLEANPQPVSQPDTNEPSDVETRLDGILSDTAVSNDTKADIVIAVVNEDYTTLSRIIKGLQRDEDITPAQAFAVSSLIKFKPKAPGKPTLEPTPDEEIGSLESLDARDAVFEGLDIVWTADRPATVVARGANWFEERLSRAARNKELPEETIRLMRWLIRKNPSIVSSAGLNIQGMNSNKDTKAPVTRGMYNVGERIVQLATDARVIATTGVHEILHHTERMMPRVIRNGIQQAHRRALLAALKENDKHVEVKAYLQKALELMQQGTPTQKDHDALGVLYKAAQESSAGFQIPNLYQFHNSSEYWATNGPIILQQREAAERGGWIAQARQWLKEFVEQLKDIAGIKNTNAVIKGLDSILAGDGEFITGQSLLMGDATAAYSLSSTTPAEIKEALTKSLGEGSGFRRGVTKFWETTAQKAIAFQSEIARVVNAGGTITPENNIEEALVRYNGIMNDTLSLDESEVSAAVYNWFTDNHQDFGDSRAEVVAKVNNFLLNTHMLERGHWLWIIKGKLGAGKTFERELILEQIRDGDISPAEGSKQLKALTAAHSVQQESAFLAQRIPEYDKLVAELVTLKKGGVDQNSMAELNTLLQAVRDRTLARNVQAGFVAENDPWIATYGFKWYVPLKNTSNAESNSEIADLDQEGTTGRASLARLNKQIAKMQGLNGLADRPLEQMLLDMTLAGRRTAEQNFVQSVYQFIMDNRELFPDVTVDVFDGRIKDGFRQVSGKKKKVKGKNKEKEWYFKLPAPGNGFILHEGDTHYVVKLPESSLLLRGILQMANEAEVGPISRVVGKGTNILSKLYTTAAPWWQTFVALPRDLTYMPMMMALRHTNNPLVGVSLMAKYMVNLSKNAFQPSNIPAAYAILTGNRQRLIEYAKDNPESAVAWLRRFESAGGSTNFAAWANTEGLGNKLTGTYNSTEGIWVVTKPWKVYEKYTTNYASLLENIGRVAAFRTLVESGMKEPEAAAKVKDFLNYDQTGTRSRQINSWIQFFKVGMTGADAIRRTFMKPDGKFDRVKFAAWAPFFMVLGVAKYLLDDELLGEDENGESRLKKIKVDTLTQKSIFKVGDKIWGFNLGLGLPQIMLAPGVMMGALMKGHITEAEAVRGMYDMFSRNAPIRPAGLPENWGWQDLVFAWGTGSLTPAPITGIIATSLNRDAFGRDIHTRYYDDGKFKADQGKNSTAKPWKDIASFMRETVGVDMYPEDVKYLARTYGGQPVSLYTRTMVDADTEAGASPETIGRITGAQVLDEGFYMRNQVHKLKSDLSESSRRLKAIESKASRSGMDKAEAARLFSASNPAAVAQIAAAKSLDKAIDAHNTRLKEIRADRMRGQTWKEAERKKADSKLRQAYDAAKKVAGD